VAFLNIEIKARCSDPSFIEKCLLDEDAEFMGNDHQVDTYFYVPSGRLKLREGNIENALIFYNRENKSGPKKSDVTLYTSKPGAALKEILAKSLGIKIIVDKQRKIFFIGNIKFHIDEVKGLGPFIEIEAIDKDGNLGEKILFEQCNCYLKKFRIKENDLVAVSYSDLLLKTK